MCNAACILFGVRHLSPRFVRGKRILEVGSRDVNGSLRHFVEKLKPREYVGVDIYSGSGVDLLCSVGELSHHFGENAFDLVICTELLEHLTDWRVGVSQLKRVCKSGGKILITTRSYGFPYHGYPYDYWRYEMDDFRTIFSDLFINVLEKDPYEPGVFLLATKPYDFCENNLASFLLFSIVSERRVLYAPSLSSWHVTLFSFKLIIKNFISKLRSLLFY